MCITRKQLSREIGELKQFPTSLAGKIEYALSVPRISLHKNDREEFLAGFRNISEMFFRVKLMSFSSLSETGDVSNHRFESKLRDILEQLQPINEVLNVLSSSQVPMEYLRFLSRFSSSFQVGRFLEVMPLFAYGRTIVFHEVSEQDTQNSSKFIELAKANDAKGLIGLLDRIFPDDDYLSEKICACNFAFLLVNAETQKQIVAYVCSLLDRDLESYGADSSFIMDAQKDVSRRIEGLALYYDSHKSLIIPFSRYFEFGPIFGYGITNPELILGNFVAAMARGTDMFFRIESFDDSGQHELQHVFDHIIAVRDSTDAAWEYRAFLASIAFSDDPLNKLSSLLIQHASLKLFSAVFSSEDGCHYNALCKIKAEFATQLNCRIRLGFFDDTIKFEPLNGKEIRMMSDNLTRSTALRLMNASYQKDCGLTYDQILEPFARIDSSALK